jgi:hypothetical protein
MDLTQWSNRLRTSFTREGVHAPELLEVRLAEAAHEQITQGVCSAHTLLIDSFLSFTIETINLARASYPQRPTGSGNRYYGAHLGEYLLVVRSVRAAEALLRAGYPLDGFGLVRDIKEQALLHAAIALRLTTFQKVNGYDALPARLPEPPKQSRDVLADAKQRYDVFVAIRKARRKEQRRVLDNMTGSTSGLTSDTILLLSLSDEMFNHEVHGSRLTATEHMEWFKNGGPLPVAPQANKRSITIYVNRSEEACWMWHRLLPLLQLWTGAFGAEWARKWEVLEESFRFQTEGLTAMGKPIGSSIVELLNVKFPFNAHCTFVP